MFIIIRARNGDGIMIVIIDGDNNRDCCKATGQGRQINLNSVKKNSRKGERKQ